MLNDSGDRTKYPTGAVRDMKAGKGRCDLLPLDIITNFLLSFANKDEEEATACTLLCLLNCYIKSNQINKLYNILEYTRCRMFDDVFTMILELAKHFEEGAEKYGIDNWKKGIPEWSYIDSAIRHLLKWARGDEDERHDRAFVWNIVCLIWTVENKADEQ